ncbi:hypothetical protein D3C80_1950690 [compost metagenome]
MVLKELSQTEVEELLPGFLCLCALGSSEEFVAILQSTYNEVAYKSCDPFTIIAGFTEKLDVEKVDWFRFITKE